MGNGICSRECLKEVQRLKCILMGIKKEMLLGIWRMFLKHMETPTLCLSEKRELEAHIKGRLMISKYIIRLLQKVKQEARMSKPSLLLRITSRTLIQIIRFRTVLVMIMTDRFLVRMKMMMALNAMPYSLTAIGIMSKSTTSLLLISQEAHLQQAYGSGAILQTSKSYLTRAIQHADAIIRFIWTTE